MHIVITGGAGFIGSQTAEALLKRGDTVSVIDVFGYGYDPIHKEHNISLLSKYDGFKLYRGDIRQRVSKMFTDDRPDVVVHLAARAGVRPSLLEPDSYSDINITGILRIMETM